MPLMAWGISALVNKADKGTFDQIMKASPLVTIPTSLTIPDMLHEMICIIDILERNLTDEAYKMDHATKLNKGIANNVFNFNPQSPMQLF